MARSLRYQLCSMQYAVCNIHYTAYTIHHATRAIRFTLFTIRCPLSTMYLNIACMLYTTYQMILSKNPTLPPFYHHANMLCLFGMPQSAVWNTLNQIPTSRIFPLRCTHRNNVRRGFVLCSCTHAALVGLGGAHFVRKRPPPCRLSGQSISGVQGDSVHLTPCGRRGVT